MVPVPFPVSEDGVRTLLGLSDADLTDDEIDLIDAYERFGDLSAFEGSENRAIARGIEARAALAIFPSLAIRVARKESSGTNTYERFNANWDALRDYLEGLVADAEEEIGGATEVAVGGHFLLATVPDRFAGTG